VLDAYAYAKGRRRGLPGMAKSHVLARGPIRLVPSFITMDEKIEICSKGGEGGGGRGGGEGRIHILSY
jgi:hypothetical protein